MRMHIISKYDQTGEHANDSFYTDLTAVRCVQHAPRRDINDSGCTHVTCAKYVMTLMTVLY